MRKLSIPVCLLLMVMIASEAWAKRSPPKPVTPAVHKGVKYVAPNLNGREGTIEAWNEKTGEKLWSAVVYTVKIDRNLEEDVQWVFITDLAIQGDSLIVTNEKNEQYKLDLTTKKVEKVEMAGKRKGPYLR